jgi:hypothetical protein
MISPIDIPVEETFDVPALFPEPIDEAPMPAEFVFCTTDPLPPPCSAVVKRSGFKQSSVPSNVKESWIFNDKIPVVSMMMFFVV